MSWIPSVLIVVIATLLIALAVTEWVVKRRRATRDRDRNSLV